MKNALVRLAVAGALAALLAGCGSSSAVAAVAGATAATAPTAATDEAEPALTPPGTELAIGEWATVPFSYTADSEGVLQVRVIAVSEPAAGDLAQFDAATQAKLAGYEARYVRVEVSGISGELAYAGVAGSFHPVTADGERGQQLDPLNRFGPCNADSLPSGFGPGSRSATCVIGLQGNGHGDVAGAMYTQTGTPYSQYDGEPIVWR